MRKRLHFTVVTLWIVLTRAYDAFSTFQHTPDLSKEANPLVSVFGLGWAPLLIIIGLLTGYAIYALYQVVFRPRNLAPAEPGFSFSEFAVYVYLGRKAHWSAMFYSFPDKAARLHQYAGFYLARCLIFAGAVSTLMWIGINHTAVYPPLHNVALIYTLIVGGCLVIWIWWTKGLYKDYLAGLRK